MNKYAELPIIAPIYSTYHYQGDASAVINDNPSIRNWFLNNNLILIWNRSYLNCTSAPKISVSCSTWRENPYLDKDYAECRTSFVVGKHECWPIPQEQIDLMGKENFPQNENWY